MESPLTSDVLPVRVSGLTHRFGERVVLQDVTFELEPGEILCVLGSSGGGKTTLLRCVGGLIVPSGGEIEIMGYSVRRKGAEARAHTGFVFQYSALFDSLTVEENVLFGLRRRQRVGPKEGTALATRLLEEVGLTDVLKQKPAELSGGMRKRVGLARALAMAPEVLLYDEPTSGLDPVTAYTIDRLIKETRDRTQATSIVVTHDVACVRRVADKVLFLHKGEAVFWGTRDEFLSADAPAVAGFLNPEGTFLDEE